MSFLVIAALPSLRASQVINDLELGLDKSAEPDGTEIDVKEAGVNLLETDVLFCESGADVDPFVVPTDSTISRDPADLEMRWIDRRSQLSRKGTG